MVFALGLFGRKTGIHFAHFGLESGYGFRGTTGVYERIYRFNSKPIREIEICEFEMHLKNCFVCHNFCLKAGSENGYGFLRFRARFSKVPIINGPVKLFGFT